MSRTIRSFKLSLELLGKNIWMIGIFLITYILALPISRSLDILFEFSLPPKAILPFVIILILLVSYIVAGFIAIVREALGGDPSLETFKLEGRKHFLPLLLGTIIFFMVWTVFFLGTALSIEYLKVVPFIAKMNVLGEYPILEFLILFGPSLLVLFFIQFFDVALIVDGYGIISSFKKSFRFVWARKLSVWSYDLVSGLLVLFLMSYGIRMNLFSLNNNVYYTSLPLKSKILRVISILFLSTIHGAIQVTYHTIYYIQARNDDSIKLRP